MEKSDVTTDDTHAYVFSMGKGKYFALKILLSDFSKVLEKSINRPDVTISTHGVHLEYNNGLIYFGGNGVRYLGTNTEFVAFLDVFTPNFESTHTCTLMYDEDFTYFVPSTWASRSVSDFVVTNWDGYTQL